MISPRKLSRLEGLRSLGEGCRELAATYPQMHLRRADDELVDLVFVPNKQPMEWSVAASPGKYELFCDALYLEQERLETTADATRALAMIDALIAGSAVQLSSVDGLVSKTWVFLDSRGLRSTVTTSRATCTLRRLRASGGRKWERYRFPPLYPRLPA